jgi:hypothetical protein
MEHTTMIVIVALMLTSICIVALGRNDDVQLTLSIRRLLFQLNAKRSPRTQRGR